ncbi:MAG: nucleotidyltransferase domain-containing protein [Cellvibrio sp.]|uniref:nucleotidyltransferase domain-containing protein n=1 Tax=Cellvibrio sp. TaxID=1965322 RepID=UPI0031B43BCC
MPSTDPVLVKIIDYLVAQYGAHTILLYGSRADGSATADSDYDVAAFAAVEHEIRNNEFIDDAYWDVFVYPEALLASPTKEYLKLRSSQILVQKSNHADDFLADLDKLFDAGPAVLTEQEIAVREQWAAKMLARIQRDDIEGNYRRVWLLTTILEDYFDLRQLWYQGPKKSFVWMKENAPNDFYLFERALSPAAVHSDIECAVRCVFDI